MDLLCKTLHTIPSFSFLVPEMESINGVWIQFPFGIKIQILDARKMCSYSAIVLFLLMLLRWAPVLIVPPCCHQKTHASLLGSESVQMAVGRSVLLWKPQFHPFLESLVIFKE